jgi:tetratricopeptide (TPR) repeat protein
MDSATVDTKQLDSILKGFFSKDLDIDEAAKQLSSALGVLLQDQDLTGRYRRDVREIFIALDTNMECFEDANRRRKAGIPGAEDQLTKAVFDLKHNFEEVRDLIITFKNIKLDSDSGDKTVTIVPTTKKTGSKPRTILEESYQPPQPSNNIGYTPPTNYTATPAYPSNQPSYSDAGTLYQQGMNLLLAGNSEQAIGCFDRVLQINSNLAEAWDGKGTALVTLAMRNNNIMGMNDALRCFEEAIRIMPQYADAWYGKGLCIRAAGIVYCNVNALNESVGCFDRALQIDPQQAAAWNDKGIALFSLGKLTHNINYVTDSLTCFERALQINPQFAMAYQCKMTAQNTLQVFRNTGLF